MLPFTAVFVFLDVCIFQRLTNKDFYVEHFGRLAGTLFSNCSPLAFVVFWCKHGAEAISGWSNENHLSLIYR